MRLLGNSGGFSIVKMWFLHIFRAPESMRPSRGGGGIALLFACKLGFYIRSFECLELLNFYLYLFNLSITVLFSIKDIYSNEFMFKLPIYILSIAN